MINTSFWICREISRLLVESGVKTVVCCPGTRNAPLLVAFARNSSLKCVSVIDERSAAFIALGIARTKKEGVALCCTSGSALLNFAPAVSEAYYSGLPLIVVSADRPLSWIDQADSQTIRQKDALADITAARYSVDGDSSDHWYAGRMLNEALLTALKPGKNRPVHINIHLGEPLNGEIDDSEDKPTRVIRNMLPHKSIPTAVMRRFAADCLADKKVAVVIGFMQPDSSLSAALKKLSAKRNVIVLAEYVANLHNCNAITNLDALLASIRSDESDYYPDVILYAGGSFVGRSVKEFLRRSGASTYRIGFDDNLIDTFCNLCGCFETDPKSFFASLASAMVPLECSFDYSGLWHSASDAADKKTASLLEQMPWCDFSAVGRLMQILPENVNFQASNGMGVRYACSVPGIKIHRFDCNRGVSGIDGSTSTALGSTLFTDRTTVLLSGDMSAQYDIAPFASGLMDSRFKMVVISNGNGGIFHVIKATRNFPELDSLISPKVCFPAKALADAYGLAYFKAESFEELEQSARAFMNESGRPALLEIRTDGAASAELYRNFIAEFLTV